MRTSIIRMKNLGRVLTTRNLAERVVARAVPLLSRGHRVRFDFVGVELITQSFADELIRDFVHNQKLLEHLAWANTNKTVGAVLRHALAVRLGEIRPTNFLQDSILERKEETDEPVLL